MKKEEVKSKIERLLKIAIDKLKRFLRYSIGCFIIGAILVFVLTTVPDWLITNVKPKYLNNDQAVTYFCTVMVSIVTLAGIYLTLEHNQKMVKDQLKQGEDKFSEERRLSVLPIITIEEKFEKDNENYSQELILYFEEGIVSFLSGLHDLHKEIIKDIFMIRTDGEVYVLDRKGFYRQFSFTNSGIGTAVNLIISIYVFDDEVKRTLYHSSVINLKPMQSIRFAVLTRDIKYLDDRYMIQFYYKDIYSNSYQQEHEFATFKTSNLTAMDFEVNQQINPE